jgi:hypothetical protein
VTTLLVVVKTDVLAYLCQQSAVDAILSMYDSKDGGSLLLLSVVPLLLLCCPCRMCFADCKLCCLICAHTGAIQEQTML